MTGHDPEIEELRDKVHCAVVLERTPPPWKLDRKDSTRLSLKYRRGKGEILIVSHAGRGWWDPTSDAKGDVFGLVQRLEPGLSFGHVSKRLRQFAGLSPRFPPVDRAGGRNNADRPVAERWAERKAVWPNSPTCRYLARNRWLPSTIIEAASAAGLTTSSSATRRSAAAPSAPTIPPAGSACRSTIISSRGRSSGYGRAASRPSSPAAGPWTRPIRRPARFSPPWPISSAPCACPKAPCARRQEPTSSLDILFFQKRGPDEPAKPA